MVFDSQTQGRMALAEADWVGSVLVLENGTINHFVSWIVDFFSRLLTTHTGLCARRIPAFSPAFVLLADFVCLWQNSCETFIL